MAPENTTACVNDVMNYPTTTAQPTSQHPQAKGVKDFCQQGISQKRKALRKKSLSFDGMNLMLLKKGMKLLWKMPKSVRLNVFI